MGFGITLSENSEDSFHYAHFESENGLAALWNLEEKLNFSAYSNEQWRGLLKTVIEKGNYNLTSTYSDDFGSEFYFGSEFGYQGPHIHYAHDDQKTKLEATLPVYLVAFMVLLYLYVRRRQRYSHLFKFSKMSKIVYAYFATKMMFSLVYFVFLVAVFDFEYKKIRLPWIFFTYSVLRSFLSTAPYMILACVSFGYGLTYFDLWRDKRSLGKAAIMTLIFYICTFKSIWDEYTYITIDIEDRFRLIPADFDFSEELAALSGIVAVLLLAISFYRTFKGTEHYELVKKSGVFILGIYILGPMFEFPRPLQAIRFFSHLFLPDEFYGYKSPDVVELLALPSFMYIWRDVEGDEIKSHGNYSELESGNGF